MGHPVEQSVIDAGNEREVRVPLGRRGLSPEIARLRAEREEERRGERRIDGDGLRLQVLEDDRRGGAEVGTNVAPGGAGAARPGRMVIDDDVDAMLGRKRVVSSFGLT